MRLMTLGPWLVTAVAVLGMAGCIGKASPATRHQLLTPVVDAPSAAPASAGPARMVAVGPVRLPGYLDRPQMVTRPAPDTLEVAEFDRWGEPLRDGVTRVLAVNLSRLLPDSGVVVFPWRSGETVWSQVIVEVAQMDGPAGGPVTLEARWRVLDRSGNEVAARVSRVRERASDSTIAAAVSRALGALSREIAAELTSRAAVATSDGGRP